jgi:hypothetical protein
MRQLFLVEGGKHPTLLGEVGGWISALLPQQVLVVVMMSEVVENCSQNR